MTKKDEIPRRILWKVREDALYGREMLHDGRYPADMKEANLVSSLLPDGRHAPVIDLDIPIRFVPSATPGHWHAYIERPMTWRQYRILLRAFYRAGLIERGFYWRGIQREATFVRLPGIPKLGEKVVRRTWRTWLMWYAVLTQSLLKLLKWNIRELITAKEKQP